MAKPDRRRFLGTLAGGLLTAPLLPGSLGAAPPPASPTALPAGLDSLRRAAAGLEDAGSEDFWTQVRDQFPIRPNTILVNAANLCPSPYPVQEAVFRLTRDIDGDTSFQNRGKFGALRTASREALARFVGADPDEIAITRNTSGGNATVVNGLDLGPGDEVVLWDQNHPTNDTAWDVAARRRGFSVRRVGTPPSPTSVEELVEPFLDALSPNTRLLAFSHVSNVSGVALPARTLCGEARARGIATLVDGAQSFGALRVRLHDMGCDFYTGSAHKWFIGPKEAGVLYVRRERIEELWPTHVGVGWERAVQGGATRFENLGQRDDAAVAAVATTVGFHETIGIDRVEARLHQLTTALKTGLRERIPAVHFHTPLEEHLSAGVVVFAPPDTDIRAAYGRLYDEYRIGGAAMGGDFEGIRLCPHIYNTMDQIEQIIEAVVALA